MLDCRKQILRKGDEVAVATSRGSLVVGTLLHDPESAQWKRLHVQVLNRGVKHLAKNPRRVLNLSVYT